MSLMPKHIQLALVYGFGLAAIFFVIALIKSMVYGDMNFQAGAALCIVGFSLGVMAAPEFEPKEFRKSWVWQLCAGSLGGGALAIFLQAQPELVFASMFVGGFLGFFAPIWLKHL